MLVEANLYFDKPFWGNSGTWQSLKTTSLGEHFTVFSVNQTHQGNILNQQIFLPFLRLPESLLLLM